MRQQTTCIIKAIPYNVLKKAHEERCCLTDSLMTKPNMSPFKLLQIEQSNKKIVINNLLLL